MSSPRCTLIRRIASRLDNFSRYAIGIPFRPYQQEVADAIVKSIVNRLGLTFVVIFPRQSGKNEAQAHIEAWLLCLLSAQDIEIVSVSPTYKPQALNAMLRLQRCLDCNPFTRRRKMGLIHLNVWFFKVRSAYRIPPLILEYRGTSYVSRSSFVSQVRIAEAPKPQLPAFCSLLFASCLLLSALPLFPWCPSC